MNNNDWITIILGLSICIIISTIMIICYCGKSYEKEEEELL